ncbi:FAD/NAD(P)-binding domain-containing protein [Setomelanomma holmii]|uniref:FAD/NAD(P)-binding domain-containing protein n=1 Tax=Setomelanomma holmii TaxID=210430 RepID=A0A9P4H9X6_9PLEO|nr:FAD/NAD(P)-binding domain-containing protein [Setomelanomma holmii]
MSPGPRHSPTGISVIIVGAGFACTIESLLRRHTPIILEKASSITEFTRFGDIISFDPNGARHLARWPGVLTAVYKVARQTTGLDFINGHRGELGVEIRYGKRVTDYWEDEEKAGVVVNGEDMFADIVVAAESVRSRGRKIVLGFDDEPKSSGYAVYRSWFSGDAIRDNPVIGHLVQGDSHCGLIGPDLHFLVSNLKGWWELIGKEDCLKYVEGWGSIVQEIVRWTPKDARLIHDKLVFHDALPTFISPKRRIAMIGDAAHPFLPTSIQGASQSIEDGVVLAACLELPGKTDIPIAVQAYERLRYERVHEAQATGVKTREKWHKANWDEIAKTPQAIHLTRESWLLDFDAEKDCCKRYEGVVKDLQGGRAHL